MLLLTDPECRLTLDNNDATLRELHYLLTGGKVVAEEGNILEDAGNVEVKTPEAFKQGATTNEWVKQFSLRNEYVHLVAAQGLSLISDRSLQTKTISSRCRCACAAAITSISTHGIAIRST